MRYILDTNALLNNPEFICDNHVIILPIVLREIENLELKRTNYDMQYRIRKAKRIISENIDNVEFISEEFNEEDFVMKLTNYSNTYGDNIILAYAKDINITNTVSVYTDDILLQLKLKQSGIQYISTNELHSDKTYSGVYIFEYDSHDDESQEILSALYGKGITNNFFNLQNNDYLEVINKDSKKVMDIFKYNNYVYEKIQYKKILNSNDIVSPHNPRQAMAIDLLLNDNILVKALTGHAGTGKDFLIFNHALSQLEQDDKQIIWIGNSVLSKGTQEIGFLPGTLEDKLRGNYMVLADVLGSELNLQDMIAKEKIVVEHVGSLRSRTFNNAYIIVGEAQNFTIEQLKLILGRVGYNSTIVFNGDDEQSDINNSGYIKFIETLKDNDLFGTVELKDVERSEVAKLSLLF